MQEDYLGNKCLGCYYQKKITFFGKELFYLKSCKCIDAHLKGIPYNSVLFSFSNT